MKMFLSVLHLAAQGAAMSIATGTHIEGKNSAGKETGSVLHYCLVNVFFCFLSLLPTISYQCLFVCLLALLFVVPLLPLFALNNCLTSP